MEDFLIDMAVGVLLRLATDAKKKAKWRKALLKVFRAIASAFPQDPDFKAAAQWNEGA